GISLCCIAIASTPDMARALARFGKVSPVITRDDREVRALPVAALECSAEDTRALRRAGLKTIGAVTDRPSVLFTARFTQAFTTKLARVLGEEDRRTTPLRPPAPYAVDHACAEPVSSHDVIERIVLELVERIAVELQARGEGGRAFETTFFRSDGAVRRIRVETSRPTRDPAIVLRLYRDRLNALADPLDPGFGFDLIRLAVRRAEPSHVSQTSFYTRDETSEQLGHLIDRLGVMFGRERVTRLHPVDTHVPERTQINIPVADAKQPADWSAARIDPFPVRPLFMFEQAHPIEATEAEAHAAPQRFRWRRKVHEIARAEGPERIADEWWLEPSRFGTRDYFRVETAEGHRYWIFRAEVTAKQCASTWFLHGVFP
ncbi:MAG: DNA polymerase Y family protein, partial [Hyphomicrobium sp.]